MFDKISKFRKEIMGAAIILIMVCHSTIYIKNDAIWDLYTLIKQFSKIGVDLFFMMSGVGLYFSYSNDGNIFHFYRKRMQRIIPQYLIVIVFWGGIAISLSLESVPGFAWKYSLISFFLSGELATWFVAAILLLYFMFPLFYRVLQKSIWCMWGLCVLIYCLSLCITYISMDGTPLRLINEVFLVRIPTFLAGLVIGAQIKKSKGENESKNYALICAAGIVFIILWLINAKMNIAYGRWIERVMFMPISICIAVILGNCLEKCSNMIREALAFFGGITLEIYLIHEKVLLVCDTYTAHNTWHSVMSNLAAVMLAVLLSKCLTNVVDNLKCKIHKEV